MSKPELIEPAEAQVVSDYDEKVVDFIISKTTKVPLVAVLLCTRNGDLFLEEQIDSIYAQDHRNLAVWVSDDGSEDDTSLILRKYKELTRTNGFSIRSGPQKGFVANFHSLIYCPNIQADYYAYADQDDIWEPDKLSRAVAALENIPNDTPAVYCSRTRVVDKNGNDMNFSPLFKKPPSFANALVQNVGGGNTMVMNNSARELLNAACNSTVVSHDWWAYILTTGAGGTVIYDPYPSVKYRQHDNNMVGHNSDWKSRLVRLWWLMKGRFREWNSLNIQALQQGRHLLTPENQSILDEFCAARKSWLISRILSFKRAGLYRQTLLGNLGLIAAVVLKKF
jgi:glycosyltransferase involved in cell wall biosynthesis